MIRDRLLDLIRADGRSGSQLARDSGIPQATVAAFVSGARGQEPRAEFVARIGRALGIAPTTLGRLLYDAYPEAEKKSEKLSGV